ncbi:cryptochrome/photolyase family protein [Streptomyces sp. SL54]|uniref:Cryptochrome/photolyase family protein n=1 Tax=Streptantibioticus silvisoli TaxID=2705255 RepID=A0ABT6VU42_9ACTN|nr:cryptochrome/photolyase family protein [Streptantibioticus silvisoli]MDI5961994.1 cryptochrome/photolyase family protein [Streptantibioticus silvisoli]
MALDSRCPHWLFGDQLGPHFLPGDGVPLVMVEAKSVFRRRRFHRAKAHLVLSAMRHRAAELGERVTYVRAETYREGIERFARGRRLTVHHPTSRAAAGLVERLGNVEVRPARGFLVPRVEFAAWADQHGGARGTLRQEDFYHWVRRTQDLLMDGDQPLGGRWNFDHDNREPPPRRAESLDVPAPYRPREDAVDEEVRRDLDRWERDGDVAFVGRDGPRVFPATRREALNALKRFTTGRLATFGPYEDAMLAGDPVMSHSLLSSSMNLGLLDPDECVRRAEAAGRAGDAPMRSVEGFVRQVAGWREYVWQLYWYFGEDYRHRNALGATQPLPRWFLDLDADAVTARCLATVLRQVRDSGWTHHIPRLMVLGSFALQRGWDPAELTDWFHRCFVDGYDWVMLANVVGMSQYADGGRMTSKPYTSGGAYVNRMSDLCGGCAYRPTERTGERACPYTAGYWAFLDRHRDRLEGNPRMARAVKGLDRLKDLRRLLDERAGLDDGPP